jgi:alpha-1,2-mannosyltransferase
LFAAASLWLEPVAMTLFFGQINLVLLALVVGDLALPDRTRGKGIGIGLAAAVKLTPLIFIAYLLFTRRVRAAAVSALTFAATIGLGFALLPHASAVFWGGQFEQPGSTPFHLLNQSLYGAILRLTHAGHQAHAYWLAAALVTALVGLGTAVVASRRGHELLGVVTCAATGLLVSPVSWSPRTVRGASATASPGSRSSSACSVSGPCPSAPKATTIPRHNCFPAVCCGSRRTAAATSSSPGAAWN